MQIKSSHYTNSQVSKGLRNGLRGMWSHSQGESPKAMPQDRQTEISRHTRHTWSRAARAGEEKVCVTPGQAQTLCLALLKPLRRHGASPTQQWQAAGGTQKALHGVFYIQTLQPQNHDISAALQGCQDMKAAANRLGMGPNIKRAHCVQWRHGPVERQEQFPIHTAE